jgi:tail fiber protein gp53
MPAYQPLIPTGFVDLDQDYTNIQGNFQQLDTVFGIDHLPFSNATAQMGYHTVVHLIPQSGNPGNNPNAGQLFTKVASIPPGGDKQLFYKTPNGGVEQISGSSGLTNGYGWFSGLLIQWGTSTKTTDGSTSFPVAFPSACFGVNCNIFENNNNRHFIFVKTKSTTAFTVSSRDSSGNDESNTFFWIAIGI